MDPLRNALHTPPLKNSSTGDVDFKLWNGPRVRQIVKYRLDWICKTWTGFAKAGFVTGRFLKHGFVKGGFVKHGFVKGGSVKHGFEKR